MTRTKYLTIAQAARALACTVARVYQMILAGKLKARQGATCKLVSAAQVAKLTRDPVIAARIAAKAAQDVTP